MLENLVSGLSNSIRSGFQNITSGLFNATFGRLFATAFINPLVKAGINGLFSFGLNISGQILRGFGTTLFSRIKDTIVDSFRGALSNAGHIASSSLDWNFDFNLDLSRWTFNWDGFNPFGGGLDFDGVFEDGWFTNMFGGLFETLANLFAKLGLLQGSLKTLWGYFKTLVMAGGIGLLALILYKLVKKKDGDRLANDPVMDTVPDRDDRNDVEADPNREESRQVSHVVLSQRKNRRSKALLV